MYIQSKLEKEYVSKYLQENVQKRGAEIIELKGFSSVFSAAQAICDHLRNWHQGSSGTHTNMSVYIEKLFGQEWGVFCSVPLIITPGILNTLK